MKTTITFLVILFLSSFHSPAQHTDVTYVEVESIIKDLQDKEKSSEFYMDNELLICFDERIREAIQAFDPDNQWLASDCPTESDVYSDNLMRYEAEINSIQELFEDPDHIERIKVDFSHIGRGETLEFGNRVILNGNGKALFYFTHGKIKTTYLAKKDKDLVVIMLISLSVIQ